MRKRKENEKGFRIGWKEGIIEYENKIFNYVRKNKRVKGMCIFNFEIKENR